MTYKVYRKENGKKVCVCTQYYEEKEVFKSICKNLNYEIYLDNKNVSSKYRPKKSKETNDE